MRTYIVFLLLLNASISAPLISQISPCTGGMAGEYSCSNYDLVSQLTPIELEAGGEVNDCWGWIDPITNVEYAIVGTEYGTSFVSLCNPEYPRLIGTLASHTIAVPATDLKVYADHAFIISSAPNHGMQVFDLNQLRDIESTPVQLAETSHFDAFGHAHNIAINEATGYAYVIGAEGFSGGPIFIDIQYPLAPVLAGGYDASGYTHDAQVVIYHGPDLEHTDKEICFASVITALSISDFTDKSDPENLSTSLYPNTGVAHQGWLTEDHRYFLMNDEGDEIDNPGMNTRTLVWDCLDLENPVLIAEHLGLSPSSDHNLFVKGNEVFQANYHSGLRVLDIEEIADGTLIETGNFDVYPEDDEAGFSGAWSVYPFFTSGLIIISSIDRGLFMVKASDDELPDTNCPAVGVEESDVLDFSLFPNPSSETLNIELKEIDSGSYLIVDCYGRTQIAYIFQREKNLQLDLSHLSSGIYHLILHSSSGTGLQLICVQR